MIAILFCYDNHQCQLLTCVVFNATGAWPSMTSLYSLGLGAPKLTMLRDERVWSIRRMWRRVEGVAMVEGCGNGRGHEWRTAKGRWVWQRMRRHGMGGCVAKADVFSKGQMYVLNNKMRSG